MRAAAMSLTSTSGFIVILLSVTVAQGADDWRVTYTSTQICALKGSTVYMSCTYITPPNAQITQKFWFTKLDGSFMNLETDSNYKGRANSNCVASKCSLKISDVTEMDSAQYKFRLIALKNHWFPPGVNLSVIDHPHLQVNVSRSSHCSDDTCVQAELRCQSSCHLPDNYKYTWFKNNKTFESETSSYSINISSEDKISCAVKDYEMFPSPQVYAPSVPTVSFNYSGEISEGSSVTLTCSSDANPPITKYTWYKKNRNIDQQRVSAKNQLVFESIQSSDSGEYYCEAENELLKRASKYILINVKSSSTSIVVGVTVAILLLIILITVFFLFRRKRGSKKSAESEVEPQSSEKRPPSPKLPKEQDNLHYATTDFSQNQPNPVYSNTGAPRHQKPQNEPIFFEYSAVKFHNNSSDHRSRAQESAEDPAMMYSTVSETK